MPMDMKVLAEGTGEHHRVDPDSMRKWVREQKVRALIPKLVSEQEAVEKHVQDSDYVVYDCEYLHRGPSVLLREIIRQKKRDLWVGGKFTYVDVALLAAGKCISKVDVGFCFAGPAVNRLIQEGSLKVYEYSNAVMTNRIMAGAMGLPFIPIRSFGGTDGFHHSAAVLIRDPYTGEPTTIVPALNPDVALIHVHQADVYGNARVFGTGISHVEAALASRHVIISTEEIIETDEIRRDPGRTSIPYYVIDAVVHVAAMSFRPVISGEISTLEVPTEEKLALLRTELDQRGQITDVGRWITRHDDGGYVLVEDTGHDA